ncbi:MAG: aminotransferase class V-fold PLP-dependent enzyme [Kofleriaceae bacterium]
MSDVWQALRAEFLLSAEFIHLNSMLVASHPRPVREALEAYARRLDENPTLCLLREQERNQQRTLDAAASYMGVRAADIALTDSTAMGLGLLYHGLPLDASSDILTTVHEHRYTHEALRLVSRRCGASLRKISLYEHGGSANAEEMVSAVERAIQPNTRLIAMTWVHSGTGVKTPVREIAEAVARANVGRVEADRAILAVDGVHGFGVEDVMIPELGCDFFIAGCHKWIFGPRGTGVIWGPAWSRTRPSIPPVEPEWIDSWMHKESAPVVTASAMSPGGMRAHEYRWALAEAFDLHLRLGKANVERRIRELNSQCKEGLAAMSHVRLETPIAPELSSGIVCFEVDGMEPAAVVRSLIESQIIASVTPYLPTYVRFSPSLINTPEEIETVLEAVGSLRWAWV